jgi:hypothetical protein
MCFRVVANPTRNGRIMGRSYQGASQKGKADGI